MIAPDEWKASPGIVLEPNGLIAVTDREHHQVVIAGPGAGKTELLAQRADFLLRTGVSPYPQRILAITTKVDAANNLKRRVRDRCGSDFAARMDCQTFHAFCLRLINMYQPLLTGADALDADFEVGNRAVHRRVITYAMMVPLALKIFNASPLPRTTLTQTYSHVFIDEFQDCTRGQFDFLKAAFLGAEGVKLIAVGDPKQGIMAWAGAIDGIFQEFAEDFQIASPRLLYQNHRSDPRLRRMQNRMVEIMDPQAAVPESELQGENGVVETIHFDNEASEARDVVTNIKSWIHQDGIVPSQIAVLIARQVDLYAAALQKEMNTQGVAFRDESLLQDLSTEPIAILIVDLLKVLSSSKSPDSYLRLTEQLICWDESTERGMADSHRLLDGIARVRDWYVKSPKKDGELIRKVVAGFLRRIDPAVLSALSFDYAHGNRLQGLIDDTVERICSLVGQSGSVKSALAIFGNGDAVRMMTIHKAKGLEFDRVVLLGVEKETFWGEEKDTRQLFFVAISRPRHQLLMTTCASRTRPPDYSRIWEFGRSRHKEFLGCAEE